MSNVEKVMQQLSLGEEEHNNLNKEENKQEEKLPELPEDDWSDEEAAEDEEHDEAQEEEDAEKEEEEALSLVDAVDCMNEILTSFKDPVIQTRIANAKEKANGDMSIIMSEIVPLVYEIQGHVMEPYGFEPSDDGFAEFAEALKHHETDDMFKVLSDEFKGVLKDATTWIAPEDEDEAHITA